MKGTEKIIEHIRADAQSQAEQILAAAQEKCAAISEEYEKKASAAYLEKIRSGKQVCEDRLEGVNRIAGMEARKSVLALKQEMVSASFDMAVDKLAALPEEQYVSLLARLAAEASVSGDEEVVLNARDRAAVGSAVVGAANEKLAAAGKNAKLVLSEAVGSFKGGLVLRRSNIEVNCTVELLVELSKGELSAELAAVLFA